MRQISRIALVALLSGSALLCSGTANADITLPGDVNTIGDVQTATNVSSPAPPDGPSCELTAAAPVVGRDSTGNFEQEGTGSSTCGSGIYMSLAVEIHYYTSPTAASGQAVGNRGTAAGTAPLAATARWRPTMAGYVRTIAQVHLTFPRSVDNYSFTDGCYRTGTNSAVCNAASRVVAAALL